MFSGTNLTDNAVSSFSIFLSLFFILFSLGGGAVLWSLQQDATFTRPLPTTISTSCCYYRSQLSSLCFRLVFTSAALHSNTSSWYSQHTLATFSNHHHLNIFLKLKLSTLSQIVAHYRNPAPTAMSSLCFRLVFASVAFLFQKVHL